MNFISLLSTQAVSFCRMCLEPCSCRAKRMEGEQGQMRWMVEAIPLFTILPRYACTDGYGALFSSTVFDSLHSVTLVDTASMFC